MNRKKKIFEKANKSTFLTNVAFTCVCLASCMGTVMQHTALHYHSELRVAADFLQDTNTGREEEDCIMVKMKKKRKRAEKMFHEEGNSLGLLDIKDTHNGYGD